MTELLKRIVQNPYLNLAVGLAVLVSGLNESITQFTETGFALRAHHGMIVLGLFHTLRSLSDVLEGLERFETVETEME